MRHLIPELEKLRARYPAGFAPSLVLPCLHRIQDDRGYVADEDVDGLCAWLGVPRIQVEEVLSYYTMFRRAPAGRWRVEVCRNVACAMRGAERLLGHVCARLGVEPGGTTPDGRVSVSTAECLGSCGTAPVMVVNGTYHEGMDAARADALLEGLR